MKFKRMDKLPGYAALLVITLIAALALGATYSLTEERIEMQAVTASDKARYQVMPEAEAFEEIPSEDEAIQFVYRAVQGENVIGYVAKTTVNGYGGEIEVIAGVDSEGKITGVSVGGASFRETPGLGAKAKDEAFTSRFIGKQAPVGIVKAQKAAGENDVDAIASATITSGAVKDGVNLICAYIEGITSEDEGGEAK